MNKLLERQIRKYLGDIKAFPEEFESFLKAVSDAYDASEEDRILMERAFDLSSAEVGKVNTDLKAERAQFLSLLSGINEVVYVADPETYELLYMNGPAKEYCGNSIGKKCYNALQGRNVPCPFCTNNQILGDNFGKTCIWEFQNLINKKWYRCIDRAIHWPDGRKVRFELAIDISELKAAEEDLKRNLEELKSFQKLTIGRELRMVELKKEINALCRELGRKEPY